MTAAKALTTSDHYGIALTCEAAEDTTWQWEPFFWSNGGKFTFANVASAPGVQALSVWKQLINDGSASKDCLNWSQTPAASTQFIDGKAAMMVNGPWNFSTLNQAKMFYGKQYGIVPVPTRVAGQHVVVPLGGEDWMISKSGDTATQQMAFEYIKGMQTPAMELKLAKLFGYLPAKIAVAKTYVKQAGPAVGGVRQPDAVRASTHARPGREVPEDLPGGVDRHTGCLVRFQIRAGRAEHGTGPDLDHLEGLGARAETRYRLPAGLGKRYRAVRLKRRERPMNKDEVLVSTASIVTSVAPTDSARVRLRPIDGRGVVIRDGLLADRQRVNREVTLLRGAEELERAGTLDNLRIAAGRASGERRGMVFSDSDVYKWLEALAWELGREPSAELERLGARDDGARRRRAGAGRLSQQPGARSSTPRGGGPTWRWGTSSTAQATCSRPEWRRRERRETRLSSRSPVASPT